MAERSVIPQLLGQWRVVFGVQRLGDPPLEPVRHRAHVDGLPPHLSVGDGEGDASCNSLCVSGRAAYGG